jgi:hypothetical protein
MIGKWDDNIVKIKLLKPFIAISCQKCLNNYRILKSELHPSAMHIFMGMWTFCVEPSARKILFIDIFSYCVK